MKRLLVLIIIFLAFLLVARGWWISQLASVSQDKLEKRIVIEKGKTLNEIAKQLKDENLIRSESAFSLYTRQQSLANNLFSGTFILSPYMTTP